MKATVTKSVGKVGQPHLEVTVTPDEKRNRLAWRCGRCNRPLKIEPDRARVFCICGQAVSPDLLLGMAETAAEMVGDALDALVEIVGDLGFDAGDPLVAAAPDAQDGDDPDDADDEETGR